MARTPSRSTDRHLGAEVAQHALGVVARRLAPRSRWWRRRACRPAIRIADLICADGTGRRYSIGTRSARAAQRQRQPCRRPSSTSSAHLLQRIEHAAHRPARQRGVAHQAHASCRGRRSGPSSAACRCRSCRNRGRRRAARARRRRGPAPPRCRPSLRIGQPSACSALAVLSTSSPSSRPVMRVRPVASAPEHQGAVRDRLVARHPHAPRQRAGDLAADKGGGVGVRQGAPATWASTGRRPPATGGGDCAAIEQGGPSLSTRPARERALACAGAAARVARPRRAVRAAAICF